MATVNNPTEFIDNLPEYLKPKLLMFLSVDLIGSTALKQRVPPKSSDASASLSAPWLSEIADFYRTFPQVFAQTWSYIETAIESERQPFGMGPTPAIWKANGDELIYIKTLTDSRQVICTISAWVRALQEYRRTLRRKTAGLDVKGCVWSAGFPVANAELIFAESGEIKVPEFSDPRVQQLALVKQYYENPDGLFRDFIGPSIDIGFRLGSQAQRDMMPISIEVAALLNETPVKVRGEHLAKIGIFYGGGRILKGVIGGAPYPLFFIDTSFDDKLVSSERALSGISSPDQKVIESYCEAFFDSADNAVFRPFIYGDQATFFRMPDHYVETLRGWAEQLAAHDEGERKKEELEQESLLHEEEFASKDEPAPSSVKAFLEYLAKFAANADGATQRPPKVPKG